MRELTKVDKALFVGCILVSMFAFSMGDRGMGYFFIGLAIVTVMKEDPKIEQVPKEQETIELEEIDIEQLVEEDSEYMEDVLKKDDQWETKEWLILAMLASGLCVT